MKHEIVSQAEWIEASRALLAEEKAWTHERDRLAAKRRALPWVRIEKDYVFEGPAGPVSLADLFDGRSQLIVYHFMFAPEWEEGCAGCSFLSDQIDGPRQHFEHNDVSWVAVSRAPIGKLEAYRQRMGWQFTWVSSGGNDFNHDFHVSFADEERRNGVFYNFQQQPDPEISDLPGASVFFRDEDGAIYHTYSSYARGNETVVAAYGWLDMVPKGRNERDGGNLGDWVRRHDSYPDDGRTRVTAPAGA
ncbi:putative dithiol-disulfide oxidoreductase (DUF899 family) [Novosphingobium sp. PhB165]|uniref:DUF899 domain-containing protein n=1 Tax=Novosphingobium sp. PhB165 TaxID=2485105 RepID=UPI00104E4B5D|nr:DUF899 domain-containing protein [Novosphingobium sp. PhB165]TCM16124.1 putative dithiol-disulfide oxidoreductase (DUF899 family) [Novosphingobium sp. PhB165]